MTLSIVVENERDRQLIGAVMAALGVPKGSYKIVTAGGKYDTISVAGTMLTLRDEPVIVVLDADTTNERLLAEQSSDLRALLNRAASPDLWRLAFFVPELEIALVHDEVVAQRIFGRPLDEVEQALRELAPKKVLERLFASTKLDWLGIIARVQADPELARMVAKAPGMRDIVEFAQQVIPSAA